MAFPSNHTMLRNRQPFARQWGWLVAFGLLLTSLTGRAQTYPLQVQVSVLPPYSAYLQDYPGAGQQVRVFIINTSRQTYQIRLAGQLTGDNGIEIRTSVSYRPPRPLTVPPGQTLLSRTDLEGLFDLNQVEVTGIDKNLLARGLPLPDGTYQLCIRALNETATNTAAVPFGQPLSAEFPIGCSAPIIVRSVEPPILISPLCDAEVTATQPQALVFTWTPPAGVSPVSVEYILRVVELPQADVDPNVFIDVVALPRSGVEVRGLRTGTFLYGPTQPPLQLGKRYAWRVQAIDRSGKLHVQNDGKAPVCSFTYGTGLPPLTRTPGLELVQTPARLIPVVVDSSVVTPPAGATAIASVHQPVSQPGRATKTSTVAAGLGELLFAGQHITIQNVTNPNPDHFAGRGTLTIQSPIRVSVDVAFADLVIRPVDGAVQGRTGDKSQPRFRVVRGKLNVDLTNTRPEGRTRKLRTDNHTGGTAIATCEAIRLIADNDLPTDGTIPLKRGAEEASVKTGFVWNSPITLTTPGAYKPGTGGKFSTGSISTYDGNLTVSTPGNWYPLASADKTDQSVLTIPFGNAYGGLLTDMAGFRLSINEDSYLEIQNNTLKAHLNGSVVVGSKKKGIPDLTIPFQHSDGITFSAQIDDPQVLLGSVDEQARLFLSFQSVNVQLGDLFDADDLPYPQWVKGLSCPAVDLWAGKMVYRQDEFHPTSKDYLSWMTIPLNPVVNRGNGYESTIGGRKDLSIQSPYLGYKGKITTAVAFIKNSELTTGFVAGEVYIPFVGAVGTLQIGIEKYGLGDADVFFTKATERTLLHTSDGNRVTLKVTGGYFENSYFHPDLWISAYNATSPTRGIDARDIHMDGVDIAITPEGKLVSDYVGKYAEAYFGGSTQKTAYLNGLDYHLARVVLSDEPDAKNARLTFNGKLVLGDKIVTKEQELYDFVFAKPDKDVFEFDNALKYQPVNGMPKLPAGSMGGLPKSGPNADLADESGTGNSVLSLGYTLERSAPASVLVPTANKTYGGSYSTKTGSYSVQFTLFDSDPTYGNGFVATGGMQVNSPSAMSVSATIRAGKMQGVKYWFAGFKYINPKAPGIPLFINLEGYGFEGRLYSHMKHVGGASGIFDDNYVPDGQTSFGLYAAMPIQSAADKGKFLWGKTGFEILFSGYTPAKMLIRGEANIEQEKGTGDATTSRLQGYADVELDIVNKTMLGHVKLTKGDLTAACVTGDAFLYAGKAGFAVSVGAPDLPVKVTAMCGSLGSLTPEANGYTLVYATSESIPSLNWIPVGIGLQLHLSAKLLDLSTSGNPWATLRSDANSDVVMQLRPSIMAQGRISTTIALKVGYSDYSLDLYSDKIDIQFSLPDPFCLAYNKSICVPVVGGFNFVLGVKNASPILKVNGDVSDMCYNDGTVGGSCEGALGWLLDGVQVVIDAAGRVFSAAGELLANIGGVLTDAGKKAADLAEDAWDALTSWW